MCVLTFAYDTHPTYSLVFAGNRDEFYDRPTSPAAFWEDAPHVLGGRDLKAGGTWMGVTRSGHWAVVTNVRDAETNRRRARSRGTLVSTYLVEEPDPRRYAERVAAEADQYNAFNLLVGTVDELMYVSTEETSVRSVSPGIHGLSNAQLNTPWPKVTTAKRRLRNAVRETTDPDRLLDLLNDRRPFPASDLPDTGVGLEKEQQLSPLFVDGADYGTRSSTVLLVEFSGGITFVERTFNDGHQKETRSFSFDASGSG